MANINIKYKGISGIAYDLTIDDGQTFTQARTAIIADEALSSYYYGPISISKGGTLYTSDSHGSTTLATAGVTSGDLLLCATDRNQTSLQRNQEMKLDAAQKQKQAGGDTTKNYYRTLNTYDIDELPTKFSGDTVVDNPNVGGLTQGRPWT